MVSYILPFSCHRQTIVFQRVYVTFMMTVCFLIDILIKSFLISRRSPASELVKTQNR